MDNEKRKKRQAKKARLLALLRERAELRYMAPSATMTMYGREKQVESLAVAVHRGSEVIEARFFDACNYETGQQMCEDAMAFARSLGAEHVQIVDGLLEPEHCADGHRQCRIADRQPEAVN